MNGPATDFWWLQIIALNMQGIYSLILSRDQTVSLSKKGEWERFAKCNWLIRSEKGEKPAALKQVFQRLPGTIYPVRYQREVKPVPVILERAEQVSLEKGHGQQWR